jgi:hypothetical protein
MRTIIGKHNAEEVFRERTPALLGLIETIRA